MTERKLIKQYKKYGNGNIDAFCRSQRDKKCKAVVKAMCLIPIIIVVIICSLLAIRHIKGLEESDIRESVYTRTLNATDLLMDEEQVLSTEERIQLLDFIEAHDDVFKVLFVSVDQKNEKKVCDSAYNKIIECSVEKYQYFSVVLVYNKMDAQCYLYPLYHITNESDFLRGIDTTGCATEGSSSITEEFMLRATEYYEDLLQGDIVSNYEAIYNALAQNAYPDANEKALVIESFIKKATQTKILAFVFFSMGGLIVCGLIWFMIVIGWFGDEIDYRYRKKMHSWIETLNKYETQEREAAEKLAKEQAEIKTILHAKQLKKDAEAVEIEKDWGSDLVQMIDAVIEKLEQVRMHGEDFVQKKKLFLDQLAVVKDIVCNYKESEQVKGCIEQYQRLYFPMLLNILDALIKNATAYHTEYKTAEEVRILNTMFDNYTEMMDYIINHSNDHTVYGIEAELEAAINMASMNGILGKGKIGSSGQ